MVDFLILGDVKRQGSKTATLDFQRMDVEPFRIMVGKAPWDSVLKGKGYRKVGHFSRRKS